MTHPEPQVRTRNDIAVFDRGNGVTTELFCNGKTCGAAVTTGTTTLPVGRSVALHRHNCDEQIVILRGQADAEFLGQRYPVGRNEVVYVPEGIDHCFHNTGDEEVLMLFIYDSGEVTRTFAATGETVAHLDAGDRAQPGSDR